MAGLVVGVPKEIKEKEGRVSVQPDGVAELVYHDRADPNLIPRSAHFAYKQRAEKRTKTASRSRAPATEWAIDVTPALGPAQSKTRRPMILVGLSDRSPRSLAIASSMCYSSDGRLSNQARSSGTPMSVLTWRRRCSQPPWTGRRRPSSDGSGLRQGETLRSAGHPDHPAFSRETLSSFTLTPVGSRARRRGSCSRIFIMSGAVSRRPL